MTETDKKMSRGFQEHASETRPVGTIRVKAADILPKDVIVWDPEDPNEKTDVHSIKQVLMITHYSEETKQSYTVLRELEEELDVER